MSPIVNLQLVVKCKKRSFHSFRVKVGFYGISYFIVNWDAIHLNPK